jgi:hypothetical protein
MTLRHVRIFLDPKSREDMEPICLDAALNEQQKIAGKWFIFGLSGNVDDKGTWYPIVCRIDGTIDFGAGYEGERWWRTNIREQTIQVGSSVSVWDDRDQEFLFQVAKIHELKETPG